MAIEIVDLPNYKTVIFNRYVKLPEGINNYDWYTIYHKCPMIMIIISIYIHQSMKTIPYMIIVD